MQTLLKDPSLTDCVDRARASMVYILQHSLQKEAAFLSPTAGRLFVHCLYNGKPQKRLLGQHFKEIRQNYSFTMCCNLTFPACAHSPAQERDGAW